MKKYIIFGTGKVAEQKYYDLVEEKAQVEYFIDSMREKEEFHGVKVIQPSDLENINVNDYIYILGTLTSKVSMQSELRKHDVYDSNIVMEKDYGSNSFESNVKNVRNLLIYPQINDKEIVNQLEKKFNLWVPNITSLYTKPDLKCEPSFINKELTDFNLISEFREINDYDLVLVWDKDALNDTELKSCKNVYCIDPSYFFLIDVRILIRLNLILLENQNKKDLEEISIRNFSELKTKAENKDAYIYGLGPSCQEYVDKTKDKEGIKVVCNAFVKSDEFMEKINPDVYVIADESILTDELEVDNDKMIKYLVKNNSYLVLPDIIAAILIKRYPEAKSKLIVCSMDAKQISFPTSNNRCLYRKAYNVITSLALPIASAICNTIYIGGCDGQKEFKGIWDYDDKVSTKVNQKIFYENEEKWRIEYYHKHINYFEEVLEYGESQGKKYYNLSNSYIPALDKRNKME